jgi:hypothetical protein
MILSHFINLLRSLGIPSLNAHFIMIFLNLIYYNLIKGNISEIIKEIKELFI